MPIQIENQTDYQPHVALLERIVSKLTSREVEVMFVDDATMRRLNAEHRRIDRVTDVLSFPLEGDFDALPLGTIVIDVDEVRRKAAYYGHTDDDETALLFIHGLLHLLGYDHETDEGQMRQKEESLIRDFGLPESLIVRVERK